MKQGAYFDESEFVQPCILLFLNFINDNLDKEEIEGSFQPVDSGAGWVINEIEKIRHSTQTETETY